MTANRKISPTQYDELANRIGELQKNLDAIGRKTPNSLVVQRGDVTFISIAPDSFYVDPDGNPITVMGLWDYQGNLMFGETPSTTDDNIGTDWFWTWLDRNSNELIASDGKTGLGLALPYISVPMYQQWADSQSATPANGTNYPSVVANAVSGTGPFLMWEGRIGYCSHPFISFDGVWGRATGSGAEVITYTAMVNGTTIGTWTETAIIAEAKQFDITEFVGLKDLSVQIFAHSSISNTDQIACGLMGAWLRQSP